MDTNSVSGLLSLISSAVTPVVLISACAALIMGTNNKIMVVTDRLRHIAAEYRQAATSPARRQQILEQIPVFYRRYRLSWYAQTLLYVAVTLFITTTLQIILIQRQLTFIPWLSLLFFGIGILLMLVACCLEIREVFLSRRCMEIEIHDLYSPQTVPAPSLHKVTT